MDPSSLIFLVIIGIWAAYLLGHWVRRRDQLATARSIDRFSDAMRVLERRPALAVPLSRPTSRPHVVAPARTSRPQITAKGTRPVSPSVARSVARVPAPRPADLGARGAAAPAPALTAPAPAPAAPARSAAARPAPARPAPRGPRPSPVLGLLLLALVVATPVSWLLVPLTPLTWPAALVVTALLVLDVVALRRRALRARDAARTRARSADRRQRTDRRRETLDIVLSSREHRRRPEAGRAAAASGLAGQVVGSLEVPQPAEEGTDVPAEQERDGRWQPVPVPPPTYTLKPKAPRTAVARPSAQPAAQPPAEGEPAPAAEPAAEAEPVVAEAPREPRQPSAAPAPAIDLEEILERRRASGE